MSWLVQGHPQPWPWELAVTRWLQDWTILHIPLQVISWPGNDVIFQGLLLMLICSLLARCGWRREAWTLAIAGSGAFLLNLGLKALMARTRPTADVVQLYVTAHGWSFPSGHVMFYTAFYGGLGSFAFYKLSPGSQRTVILTLCVILVGLVGVSRLFLGAHWLLDVVGGYGFGLAWLLAVGAPLWEADPDRRPAVLKAALPAAPRQAENRG
ncbi:MAG: phosphatase PAP2 family protein [Acidobacteriota bacterium]